MVVLWGVKVATKFLLNHHVDPSALSTLSQLSHPYLFALLVISVDSGRLMCLTPTYQLDCIFQNLDRWPEDNLKRDNHFKILLFRLDWRIFNLQSSLGELSQWLRRVLHFSSGFYILLY